MIACAFLSDVNPLWLFSIVIIVSALGVVYSLVAGIRFSPSIMYIGVAIGLLAGAFFSASKAASKSELTLSVTRIDAIEGVVQDDVFADRGDRFIDIRPFRIVSREGGEILASSDRYLTIRIASPISRTIYAGSNVRIEALEHNNDASIPLSSSRAPIDLGSQSLPFRVRSNSFASIETTRSRLSMESRALFGALFLGKNESSLDDLRYYVRRAGCIHLFALSGMHVGVLIVILSALFRPIVGRRGARFLSVPIIIGYVLLIGSPPALLRAGSMFVCATVLHGASRRARQIDVISAAAIIGVFVDPASVRSISFSLTFLAVIAIVCASKRWSIFLRRYLPKLLAEPLGVSFAAYFGTAWYVSISFGEIYPFGIVSSLILGPLVTFFLGTTTILLGFEYLVPHRGYSFGALYESLDLLALTIRSLAVELSRLPPLRIEPIAVLVVSLIVWYFVINRDRSNAQL